MAKKIKGITIEIGGNVQPLNKALEGVNKKSRDLQSELRQVDRLLKLDPRNTELVAQKQKLLGEAVGNTKTKLDTLKEAERQVQEQFRRGEIGEEQYRAIKREVISTEQNLKSLKKQLNEVNNSWKRAGDAVKEFGKKATDIGKDLSMKVSAPIIGLGAVAFKMAADAQDAMGATEQIFGSAAQDMLDWASSLESYYGIAKGEALEYANMMGSMLVNIGGKTEEEAARQAQTLIKLAGDLTAMYGGTTEDAVRALTGALKGNNTMLDNYGMAVNDALIKTKAMEMGLIKEGQQLDLAAKQAATLALIMEQSGAAQGQAAREADGASGSMRALMTELKNLAVSLGEELLPVITPLITGLKDIIARFSDMSPATKKIIVIVGTLLAAIGPLLMIIGSIATGIGAIMPILGAVGGAIGAISAPVLGVVAAIAALIAIIVLVAKHWDEIMAAIKSGWEWLAGVFQKWWEGFKDFWGGIWGGIKNVAINVWEGIIGFFTKARDKIVGVFTKIKDGILGVWDSIWNGVKSFVNLIIGGMNSMIRGINKIKVNIPDWVPVLGGGTLGFKIPEIPVLHTGTDYFKPPAGMREGLALLERGERVIPKNQATSSEVKHSGTITVRGVTDEGQLVAIKNLLIEDLLAEVRA